MHGWRIWLRGTGSRHDQDARWLRVAAATAITLGVATVGGVLAAGLLAVKTADKAAVIADVLAAATLALAGIAALVALRAYLIAAGKPDLVLLRRDAGRWPLRLSTQPRAPGHSLPRIGANPRPGLPYVRSIELALQNIGGYSARNPAVKITFHGFWAPVQPSGWSTIRSGPGGTVQSVQWDGGADYAVHGSWTRVLPPVVLDGGLSEHTGAWLVA